ncbi:MAG: type II toxin-antitoxin system VapC family toxin [Verrucomicrobia bacterium]|nr:type II toxin-antitoxin system VapC family toxin [Verrucomicrobiota bacterium]
MKTVFADTAFFLALVNARDHLHPQAAALNESPPGPMLTTEWVLIELGDALAIPSGRERFSRLVATLRSQPDVEIVPASHELFEGGCALFARRADKEWSLTDCTSFVVMQERGLSAALTSDQHFEQAGFQRLMQP